MKIGEVAAHCGLSIDTIRYYEASGLCPPLARGADGQRRFSADSLDWLILLASLRQTGMPMVEMRQFAALYRAGDDTVALRRDMLRTHAQRLEQRKAELDACQSLLTQKLARYAAILGETV